MRACHRRGNRQRKARDVCAVVGRPEDRTAGDQDLGAGSNDVLCVGGESLRHPLRFRSTGRPIIVFNRLIFSSIDGMKLCPPKPGLTDITKIDPVCPAHIRPHFPASPD